MKYQYVFEINRALSRAFTRSIQLSVGEGDVTVEEIASDIDSALGTWRANVNCFRSDNSDRFTAGQPMPPEVKDLLFFLRQSYDFAKSRAACDAEDSGEWSDRLRGLALAIGVVLSYYPDAENGSTTSTTTKGKSNQHRSPDKGFDYYVGSNFDADFVRDSIKKRLDDHKGGVKGGIEAARVFLRAIKEGEITANTMKKAFYKEFNLSGTYRTFTDGIKRLERASGSGG